MYWFIFFIFQFIWCLLLLVFVTCILFLFILFFILYFFLTKHIIEWYICGYLSITWGSLPKTYYVSLVHHRQCYDSPKFMRQSLAYPQPTRWEPSCSLFAWFFNTISLGMATSLPLSSPLPPPSCCKVNIVLTLCVSQRYDFSLLLGLILAAMHTTIVCLSRVSW